MARLCPIVSRWLRDPRVNFTNPIDAPPHSFGAISFTNKTVNIIADFYFRGYIILPVQLWMNQTGISTSFIELLWHFTLRATVTK